MDAPERVASLVLAQPYLPTLTGEDGTLGILHQAADAAEKGQTDQALDLYLGLRLGGDWRDRLPKARQGAMRRAAGSLAPSLAGLIGASFDRAALAHLETRVTLLLPADAPASERELASRLTEPAARAWVETLFVEDAGLLAGQDWTPAISRALLAQASM